MNEKSAIPYEWQRAAEETAKALSIAHAIERRQYPEGDAPAGLVAALLISAELARVQNTCEGIYDAINNVADPRLCERLGGIESQIEQLVLTVDHHARA